MHAYLQHLPEVAPGRPSPSGLDVRLSGMIRGVLWRHKSYEQFGVKWAAKSWEEVEIEPEWWAYACSMDHHFYPRLA